RYQYRLNGYIRRSVYAYDILQLCRNDSLMIGRESFSVDRITPDDGGCSYIRLRREGAGNVRAGGYYEGA
ncbi:hypothetical protein CUA62_22785, partial [Shigella flexneri]